MEAVEISQFENLNQPIEIGGSCSLSASVKPEDADKKDIVWSSSDESIATVSDGIVMAHKEGSVIITACTENGIYDNIEITVNEVIAESIEIEYPETIIIGETTSVSATIKPNNTSYQDILWESSDDSVITIDKSGYICAVGIGTATIKAIQKDITGTVEIKVLPIDVEDIDISYETLEEELGIDETLQFYASIRPENATYSDVIWSTSNTEVATIDENGLLTTFCAGDVIVYARTIDGVEKATTITVINKKLPIAIGISSITCGMMVYGVTALAVKKKKTRKKGRFEK